MYFTGRPFSRLVRNVRSRSALSLGATLCTRGVAAAGGLALGYWLAQIGGADALGEFTYAQSILMILATIGRFGTDQSLIRLVAQLDNLRRGGAASRYLIAGVVLGVVLGFATAALALPVVRALGMSSGEIGALRILIWALPPFIALNVTSGYLKGQHWTAFGTLLDIGTVSGTTAAIAWLLRQRSMVDTAELFVLATYFMAIVMFGFALCIARVRYRSAWLAPPPEEGPALARFLWGGWPFTIIALALLATQSSSFALGGGALDNHTLGLLRAAERLALIIGFALTAISPFLAPRIANAYFREGDRGVRAALRQGILLSVAAAAPAGIIILAFGHVLLRAFGSDFVTAMPFLILMGCAQLAQACTGSTAVILAMTGNERAAMRVSVSVLALGVVLFPVLSNLFGGIGFASAYLIIVLIKETLNLLLVHRRFLRREHVTAG